MCCPAGCTWWKSAPSTTTSTVGATGCSSTARASWCPADYRLAELNITDVALSLFHRDTFTYNRNVAADVSLGHRHSHGCAGHSEIEISPADDAAATAGHQVALESDGSTEITVTVHHQALPAETGTTYTITLNELAGTSSPLSGDATLSSLTLSGIDYGRLQPRRQGLRLQAGLLPGARRPRHHRDPRRRRQRRYMEFLRLGRRLRHRRPPGARQR